MFELHVFARSTAHSAVLYWDKPAAAGAGAQYTVYLGGQPVATCGRTHFTLTDLRSQSDYQADVFFGHQCVGSCVFRTTPVKNRLDVSEAPFWARGDGKTMRRQSSLGLRLSFVVGLPCSIGMSLLSSQILSLIYHFDTPEALRVTAELLSLSSLTIVLFTVVQSTSGILQGLRKQRIPMYTLMAGVAVKVLLNYTLIGMPGINIYGAPIASLTCYTISMLPNLWYVRKYTGMKLDLKGILLRPALATALMGAVLALAIRLLPSGRLWTLVLVALGVCTYAAFALLTGAHEVAVYRDAERAGCNSVRGVAQFRVRHQAAHQSDYIQHYFASVSAFAGTASSFATIMERSTPSVIL